MDVLTISFYSPGCAILYSYEDLRVWSAQSYHASLGDARVVHGRGIDTTDQRDGSVHA